MRRLHRFNQLISCMLVAALLCVSPAGAAFAKSKGKHADWYNDEAPPEETVPPIGHCSIEAQSPQTGPTAAQLPSSFEVSDTGAARYSIPIEVPPGRNDVAPSLLLEYSSDTNVNTHIGVGWRLSGLSQIHRCGTTANDYGGPSGTTFDEDRFCLDGNPLSQVGGTSSRVEYRTLNDTFNRVIRHKTSADPDGFFEVRSRDGKIHHYGRTLQARLDGPRLLYASPGSNPANTPGATQHVTQSWWLETTEDRRGNGILYTYNKIRQESGHDNGAGATELLPHKIHYTTGFNQPTTRRVEFTYENRPDTAIRFIDGLAIGTTKRLQSIQTYAPDASGSARLLREYRLKYKTSSTTDRSLVESISACDGSGTCLPGLQFNWTEGTQIYNTIATPIRTRQDVPGIGTQNTLGMLSSGDFNGDGYADLLTSAGKTEWAILWGNGTSFAPPVWLRGLPTEMSFNSHIVSVTPRPVDVNNDGTTDLMVTVVTVRGAPNNSHLMAQSGVIFYNLGFHLLGGFLLSPFQRDVTNCPYYDHNGNCTNGDGVTWSTFMWNWVDVDGGGPGTSFDPTRKPDHFIDLNGDGLLDFVKADSHEVPKVWNRNIQHEPNVFTGYVASDVARYANVHDLAGGFLGDSRVQLLSQNTITGKYEIVSFDDWSVSKTYTSAHNVHAAFVADVNGDGLDDLIDHATTGPFGGALPTVRLNYGGGFLEGQLAAQIAPNYLPPQSFESPAAADGVRVADFDGDGVADFLALREGQNVVLNKARSGKFQQEVLPFQCDPTVVDGKKTWASVVVLDANGDGALDIACVQNGALQLHLRVTPPTDKLEHVYIGTANDAVLDVQVSYSDVFHLARYTQSNKCKSSTYPYRCLSSGVTVVAAHHVNTGGFLKEYLHHYEDGYIDILGGSFLGFGTHRVDDVDGKSYRTTTFDPLRSEMAAGSIVYPFAMAPVEVKTVHHGYVNQQLVPISVETQRNDYTVLRPGLGRYLVVRSAEEVDEWQTYLSEHGNLQTDQVRSYIVKHTHDGSGRLISKELISNLTPWPADYFAEYSYAQDNENEWLWDLTTSIRESSSGDDGAAIYRWSSYKYDPQTGEMNSRTVFGGHESLGLTTSYLRNQFGGVEEVIDAELGGLSSIPVRSKNVSWTSDGYFPSSMTDPNGNEKSYCFEAGFGQLVAVSDANGAFERFRHDAWGRVVEAQRSSGEGYRRTYRWGDRGVNEHVESYNGAARVTERNIRGQPIRSRLNLGNDGWSLQDFERDAEGRIVSISEPYLLWDRPSAFTTYEFDGLGRHISARSPSSQVTFTHRGLDVIISEDFSIRAISRRPDGFISQVREYGIKHGVNQTDFRYSGFGSLSSIAVSRPDNSFDFFEFKRDQAGRQIEEIRNGQTLGGRTLNAFGEVIESWTPEATVKFSYDAGGRLVGRETPQGWALFEWDSAPNGKGKIARTESSDGVVREYEYDYAGRVSEEALDVGDGTYRFSYAYNGHGGLQDIVYPDTPNGRMVVRHRYDSVGRLVNLYEPQEGTIFWELGAMNAAGKTVTEYFGSGQMVGTRYIPGTNLIDEQMVDGPSGTDWGRTYGYGSKGKLFSAKNTLDGTLDVYGYDLRDRLSEWVRYPAQGIETREDYAYSESGNLLSARKTTGQNVSLDTYTYSSGSPSPDAVVEFNGDRLHYDANGRLMANASDTFRAEYNWLGQPTYLRTPDGESSYFYDGTGVRTLAETSLGKEILVGRRSAVREAALGRTTEHLVTLRGRPIVQVATGDDGDVRTTYLHTDRMGSLSLATAADSTVEQEYEYDPWGAAIDRGGNRSTESYPSDIAYSGASLDDAVQILDLKARVYSPRLRRMLTPDPLIGSIERSQSMNRYSYVENSPVTLIDPFGLRGCDPSDPFCSDVVDQRESREPTMSPFERFEYLRDIGIENAIARSNRLQVTQNWVISVPQAPPGHSLWGNVALSEQRRNWTWRQGSFDTAGFAIKAIWNGETSRSALMSRFVSEVAENSWFFNFVRRQGPWDYKYSVGPEWGDFGNFNFGMNVAALGLPLEFALRGSGWQSVQALGEGADDFGRWDGDFPFGDDPADALLIMDGFLYYHMTSGGREWWVSKAVAAGLSLFGPSILGRAGDEAK